MGPLRSTPGLLVAFAIAVGFAALSPVSTLAQTPDDSSLQQTEQALQKKKADRAARVAAVAAAQRNAERRAAQDALNAVFSHIQGEWYYSESDRPSWHHSRRDDIDYCSGEVTFEEVLSVDRFDPESGLVTGKYRRNVHWNVTHDLTNHDTCADDSDWGYSSARGQGVSDAVFSGKLVQTQPYERWDIEIETIQCNGSCGRRWDSGAKTELSLKYINGGILETNSDGSNPTELRKR
jgi:hypothetical protein